MRRPFGSWANRRGRVPCERAEHPHMGRHGTGSATRHFTTKLSGSSRKLTATSPRAPQFAIGRHVRSGKGIVTRAGASQMIVVQQPQPSGRPRLYANFTHPQNREEPLSGLHFGRDTREWGDHQRRKRDPPPTGRQQPQAHRLQWEQKAAERTTLRARSLEDHESRHYINLIRRTRRMITKTLLTQLNPTINPPANIHSPRR